MGGSPHPETPPPRDEFDPTEYEKEEEARKYDEEVSKTGCKISLKYTCPLFTLIWYLLYPGLGWYKCRFIVYLASSQKI